MKNKMERIYSIGWPGLMAGMLLLLAIARPELTVASASNLHASLVRVIDTSAWVLPSADPMDITYLPGSNHLSVTDSEIEEYTRPYWHGGNLFETTLDGTVLQMATTSNIADALALSAREGSQPPQLVITTAP